jgi:hypothetical protein
MGRINLGDKVKDTYSGFTGWVHGVSHFITGCDQVCVNPRSLDEKGAPRDGVWFDETRLEVLEAVAAPIAKPDPQHRGGPTPGEAAGMRRN